MNEEPGTALVPQGEQAATQKGFALPGIFQEQDPDALIERAERIAARLIDIVEKQELYTSIGKNKHVHFEGWQILGAFMGGIMPHTEWVHYVESPRHKGVWGYEARATARYMGLDVAAAEAACWSSESKWAGKEEFEVRSMAQTRACAKALSMALRWVMKLAGYEGTPAEEMDGAHRRATQSGRQPSGKPLGTCALHNKSIVKGRYGPYCPTKVSGPEGKEVWCRGEPAPQGAQGADPATQEELPDPATFRNLGDLFTACQKHLGVTRPEVLKILGVTDTTAIGDLDNAWYTVLETKKGPPIDALPAQESAPQGEESQA